MSEILNRIKADFVGSRKARTTAKSAFLSTLIGEIESNAVMVDGVKTVTDEAVIAVLKSFEKKANEILALGEKVDHNARIAVSDEKLWLSNYLPAQLSADELRAIFTEIDHSNMGLMMKHLKDNYAGRYDGKLASTIAKEFV